jgi:hypothetical protein
LTVAQDESRPESRGNFDSLVPWARRLFAEGKSVGEVMRAIYGVDLPAEVYVLDRAYPKRLWLPLDQTFHPWELFVLAEPGREVRGEDPWAREQEENAFAQNPNFLPLLRTGESDAEYGYYVLGYDIEELRNGKTTILGHQGDIPATGAEFEVIGTSLLDVLHTWMSDHLRMIKHQFESPMNRGAGSLEKKDVDEVVGMLRGIEELQKEAASLARG